MCCKLTDKSLYLNAYFQCVLEQSWFSFDFSNNVTFEKEFVLNSNSWLTALFRAIFLFRNKTEIQKKLTQQKLSENGLSRYTGFG